MNTLTPTAPRDPATAQDELLPHFMLELRQLLQTYLTAEQVRRFLDHVTSHDKVWVAKRIDIARHWIATHPYKAPSNKESAR